MSKITLNYGRDIQLSRLYQRYTYSGVLAGLPTPEKNERHCQDALTIARENPWLRGNAPVTLVPPKLEHHGPLNPKSVAPMQRKTGSNVTSPLYYQRLPSIVCVGCFESGVLKSKPDDFGSHLCIVWFQPTFALPIDQNVAREIQGLAWEELARSYDL